MTVASLTRCPAGTMSPSARISVELSQYQQQHQERAMKPRQGGQIGVLTSGGDAPGLNAVIRAVVKTGQSRGYEILGIAKGFEGLIGEPDYKVLTGADVRGILPLGGTILQTTNKGHFGGQRVVDAEDDPYAEAMKNIERLG